MYQKSTHVACPKSLLIIRSSMTEWVLLPKMSRNFSENREKNLASENVYLVKTQLNRF